MKTSGAIRIACATVALKQRSLTSVATLQSGAIAALTGAFCATTFLTSPTALADPLSGSDQHYLTEVRYVVGPVSASKDAALISWGHQMCSGLRSGAPPNQVATALAREYPANLHGDKASALVWAYRELLPGREIDGDIHTPGWVVLHRQSEIEKGQVHRWCSYE